MKKPVESSTPKYFAAFLSGALLVFMIREHIPTVDPFIEAGLTVVFVSLIGLFYISK